MMHFNVYAHVAKPQDGGRPYYYYERTCGTEQAAKARVKDLGGRAIYLVDHHIEGAFC